MHFSSAQSVLFCLVSFSPVCSFQLLTKNGSTLLFEQFDQGKAAAKIASKQIGNATGTWTEQANLQAFSPQPPLNRAPSREAVDTIF